MIRQQELEDSELQALPRYQLAARHERLLKKFLVSCLLLGISFIAALWFDVLPGFKPVLVVQAAILFVLGASLQSAWWVTRWRLNAVLRKGALVQKDALLQKDAALRKDPVSEKDVVSEKIVGAHANTEKTVQGPDIAAPEHTFEPLVSSSRFTQLRSSFGVRWLTFFSCLQRRSSLLNTLAIIALASISLLLVVNFWNVQSGNVLSNSVLSSDVQSISVQSFARGQVSVRFLVIVCLLILAFAALVLERYFTHLGSNEKRNHRASSLPEATHIAYQLRVYISLSLVSSIALLFTNDLVADDPVTNNLITSDLRQWPQLVLLYIGLVPAAIAIEFLLRAALSLFAPPRQHEPELLAESFLAALWRWPIKPFSHLQDEFKQRFGIDLRQSWAFAYIRRSLLSVIGVLLGIAWLLSGLVEIPMAERGIYERFGAPVAVWQPGIHAGLPWPFGRVQRLENGVVHELSATTSEPAKSDDKKVEGEKDVLPSAEGAPPVTANRLWDASHLAEKSQIIASEVTTGEGNRQSFHIVNMDVRFMYRIGLSDEAALHARYTSADAPALIRSTANRILVRYFASRTLEGVLGEARTQMARDIGTQLQADLDTLNSGVEIMSTVLEAIHPPAAAANAYHAVQAAQIKAHAIISRERGSAAQQVNLAQLRAGIARDQASASARETLATAEVANRRFSAERDAYQQGGKAFLMEQYFAQLTQGLKSARVLLVDHRLPNSGATIDLRDFSGNNKNADLSPALAPGADYQESP